MVICVYGASRNEIAPIYIEEAEKLGEFLAKEGHTVVFGGGKNGIMGAIARGVTKGNGTLIGVAPTFFRSQNVYYDKCTDFIDTETMHERKKQMEDMSDAFIVMPGGIGTYEEFFETYTLKHLGRHNKPILIYNTENYYTPVIASIEHAISEGFLAKNDRLGYSVAQTPEEVKKALNG